MTNCEQPHSNPVPKLVTASQWRQLVKNDFKSSLDIPPVVKLFAPDANATWLLHSVSRANPDLAYGLCDLGLGFPELGYVSLAELFALRGNLGLPVERDRYCSLDLTLREYDDRASMRGQIEV